jgi:hypothetical protein
MLSKKFQKNQLICLCKYFSPRKETGPGAARNWVANNTLLYGAQGTIMHGILKIVDGTISTGLSLFSTVYIDSTQPKCGCELDATPTTSHAYESSPPHRLKMCWSDCHVPTWIICSSKSFFHLIDTILQSHPHFSRSLLLTNGKGECLAYRWIAIPYDSEDPR